MLSIHRINNLFKFTLLSLASRIHRPIAKVLYTPGTHFCPICKNNVRRFLPFGDPPRANARCPVCRSLERHRLDWMLFTKHTDLFDGSKKKMLHVAPEEFLSALFRRIDNLDYISADLRYAGAMVQMDITNINFPENHFDVIYCSHVLEHVANDRKAIAEFYRVLRHGGWAVLQVPITAERTYENPAIVDPDERRKHFGQRDHVRRCGPDYVERMRSAGFVAQTLRATDLVTEADCENMGFQPDRLIFFCRKPSLQKEAEKTEKTG